MPGTDVIIKEQPSPNCEPRRAAIQHVILHYTGMKTAEMALNRLCDAAAKVSAHYLIDEDGTTYRLVPEDKRAWHAGVAYWRGMRDINSASIGIELVNPGHDYGYRAFPAAQMTALTALLGGIRVRHRIAAANVLGHSDVAPGRKQDPGELFPWPALAVDGFGLWPEETQVLAGVPDLSAAFRRLSDIGYAVPLTPAEGSDILNADTAATDVIAAFQRRYRPHQVDGTLDSETATRIAATAVAHAMARRTS